MDNQYLITKSNYFIMHSSYDLSIEEQKIILTLASMVQPEDDEFKAYKFKIKDFMNLLNVKDQSKYTEIPRMTKGLMKKVFEIHEGNKIIQTAWLSGAVYEKGSGEVELKFSSYLKPYMLQLKDKFTQYQLANILSMKSKYSPRIYEILKCNQFKKQGFIVIELDELRKLLKAEDIYPLYADFKRYILLRTKKELQKLSDICFDFEEIKTGRKVTAVKFYIHSKNKAHREITATREPLEGQLTISLVKDESFTFVKQLFKVEQLSDEEVTKILDVAEGDVSKVRKAYFAFVGSARTQKINNIVGWIIKAIKEDWSPVRSKDRQSPKKGIHNFKQRDDWNFEELERLEEQYQLKKLKDSDF